MNDTTYNGWHNRATWNVALWLGNDEGMYREAIRFGRAKLGVKAQAQEEEKLVEQFCRDMFGDMTPDGDKLDEVYWPEIVADIREMAGIEDDEENEDKEDAE